MKKFIVGILISILLLSMLTACGNKTTGDIEDHITETESTKIPSTNDTENPNTEPSDSETTPNETSDNHRVVTNFPTGIISFTTNSEKLKDANDELDVENHQLNNKGNTSVLTNLEQIGDSYIMELNKDFNKEDTLFVKANKRQEYENVFMIETADSSISASCSFTTEFDFCIANQSVTFHTAMTEFAYESKIPNTGNIKNCIQVYGQLEELGILKIHYDGTKYIISSDQDIYGLRVATIGFDETEEPIFSNTSFYGKEFEIYIDENGQATFVRTKR